MLDVAIQRTDGTTVVDPQLLKPRPSVPLPVTPALRGVLPDGLRRGSTVSVGGSLSLLLALLAGASADGAWCALVGFPTISAEAAVHHGLELRRLALIPHPEHSWTTAVGALLDAVDIVAARPPAQLPPSDVRRLTARARARDAVFVPYFVGNAGGSAATSAWPGSEVRLRAGTGEWVGLEAGTGRLRARRLTVTATGRGSAAQPRTAELWLPGDNGAAQPVTAERPATPATPTLHVAPVVELAG
jgi:hypothetical protein